METSEDVFNVWITKWALTSGIEKLEAEWILDSKVVSVKRRGHIAYFYKNNWHLSLEDAKKRAEDMRRKKIASLEKQIEKLKSLQF